MQKMQEQQGPEPRLLTAQDVERLLHVDKSTVYRMASDGRLPAFRVGRQWRFPAERIERLVGSSVADRHAEPIPAAVAQAVVDIVAEALEVMMVVTDMSGLPLTEVSNPCLWFSRKADDPSVLDSCLAEWRALADDTDFQPRFRASDLGFECARSMIRSGSELVGMVLAGGVAPDGATTEGLYTLDPDARTRVLEALPRVASALSRLASTDLSSQGA